jgi:hypothetical protein
MGTSAGLSVCRPVGEIDNLLSDALQLDEDEEKGMDGYAIGVLETLLWLTDLEAPLPVLVEDEDPE